MSLPHRFPFELVDRVDGEEVVVQPTAGAWWSREASVWPIGLVVEAAAQSAARIAGARPGEELALAGIESARFESLPELGWPLRLRPRVERAFASLVLVAVEVRQGDRLCGEVTLLLAAGDASSPGV